MDVTDFMIRARSKRTVLAAEIQRETILEIAIWCQGKIQTDPFLTVEVETADGPCFGYINDWVVYESDKNVFHVVSCEEFQDGFEVTCESDEA